MLPHSEFLELTSKDKSFLIMWFEIRSHESTAKVGEAVMNVRWPLK